MELLLCHDDSYLREVDVNILACVPRGERFTVTTDRSIAFPGGGGQPADEATLDALPILECLSHGAIGPQFIVDGYMEPGLVSMKIDWSRRFDHMQQHSAQHILTALAVKLFGWETLAFHLNAERSDVVLDVRGPSWRDVLTLEEAVNEVIRSATPVAERQMSREAVREGDARYRRLPPGDGDLRLIDIGGVDLNPCGGTHVSNTAHIQLVKILAMDADKGNVRLQFLAGGRASRHYEDLIQRESRLTALMSEPGPKHAEGVARLHRELSQSRKRLEATESALGSLWVATCSDGPSGFYWQHRPEVDSAYLTAISRTAESHRTDEVFLVITGSREAGGAFSLFGPEALLDAIAPTLLEVLDGRGGGRGRRRQGKVRHTECGPALQARLANQIREARS